MYRDAAAAHGDDNEYVNFQLSVLAKMAAFIL